jgi:1-deoxy-D-xylulose-5-phosphate reductoisomerase
MAELADLVRLHKPSYVAVPNAEAVQDLKHALGATPLPTVLLGEEGLCQLAALQQATHVVAAIVGAAGLPSCIAAAQAGKTILLANKEALVMAGSFFLQAVKDGGATLLPLDSEHNALFQCLPAGQGKIDASVRSVWLTASGGPFLKRDASTLHSVTPDEACKHPKWSMGRKISVDSATLMNKGLEVIEAALMYGLPAERVKVAIHPQSTIHALVQYVDGSLLAHLSHPDMRVPIAQALAYPQRIESGVPDLDMTVLESLSFAAPDVAHFPCLALAYQALRLGQHGCIALNAANEVAVEAFLNGSLLFSQIPVVVKHVLETSDAWITPSNIEDVYVLDRQARALAELLIRSL